MNKPTKKYILWLYGDGGYHPTEFDTAEEALLAERYTSDFYITESVNSISANTYFDKPKPAKAEKEIEGTITSDKT